MNVSSPDPAPPETSSPEAGPRRWRGAAVDLIGLGLLLGLLFDYLRPSLLLQPTITAGGDTPCHYPTAAFFADYLLPKLRLHGWYPGAYLGHPLLLYYFPLPFLVMAALAPWLGMPVAFKLGTALPVLLLPILTYLTFRLLGFRSPGPLLGASASVIFLFIEDNPIWGGTLASTLAGEFSYTYGLGLGVLFLGVAYRAHAAGSRPWGAAAWLALTALAHGYAVLWAGLSASFFLYGSRRPLRTLRWLASVAIGAFVLAAFWLLPLLSGWGLTTSYDDPWITVSTRNLAPPMLWPLLIPAVLGLVAPLLAWRRSGGPDLRLLFLFHAALGGAALAAAGPALGIIDVRFVPFAQLSLCLLGAAAAGLALERLAAPGLAALGLVLLSLVYADDQARVLRHWISWNYSGLEAKELWPAFRELADRLQGTVADPRVAVEYSQEHERAGSIRMYETLPFFSGRSTLEGVYNQASLMTHPVYYVTSELAAVAPNPFKKREYSSFDTESALRHLRLFNVSEIVALSPALIGALNGRRDVELVASIRPYEIFRLKEHGPGYVEPLAYLPHRSSARGFRDKAYRWLSRKPTSPVHVVYTDDARFPVAPDPVSPPEVELPGGVEVRSHLDSEAITIRTSRPGHPLLVKVAYHRRWRAEGADGPYLVSPGLMLIVPREPEVRLAYSKDLSDHVGLGLSLGGLVLFVGAALAGRRQETRPTPPPAVAAGVRWGGVIPLVLLLSLAASRFLEH